MGLMEFLELLDKPRQAVWNFGEGVGNLVTGEGSLDDVLMSLPGALGGLAGGALAATGVGAPLAILGGSLLGGAAQSVPGAREAMRPGELLGRFGIEEDSFPGIVGSLGLGIATDPLTWAIPGFGAGRGASKAAVAERAPLTPYAGIKSAPISEDLTRYGGDYVPNYGGDSKYKGFEKWSDEMADRNVERGFARDADDTFARFTQEVEGRQNESLISELMRGNPGAGGDPLSRILMKPKATGFEYDDWMRGYDPDLAMKDPFYAGLSVANRDLPREGLAISDLMEQRAAMIRQLDSVKGDIRLDNAFNPGRATAEEAGRLAESAEVDTALRLGTNVSSPSSYGLGNLARDYGDIGNRSMATRELIDTTLGRSPYFGYRPVRESEMTEIIKAMERAGVDPNLINKPLLEGRQIGRTLLGRPDPNEFFPEDILRAGSVAELPPDIARMFQGPNPMENLIQALKETATGPEEIQGMIAGANQLGLGEWTPKLQELLDAIISGEIVPTSKNAFLL